MKTIGVFLLMAALCIVLVILTDLMLGLDVPTSLENIYIPLELTATPEVILIVLLLLILLVALVLPFFLKKAKS